MHDPVNVTGSKVTNVTTVRGRGRPTKFGLAGLALGARLTIPAAEAPASIYTVRNYWEKKCPGLRFEVKREQNGDWTVHRIK